MISKFFLKMFLRRLFRKKTLPENEILQVALLEERLGYIFRDLKLLKKSLSHKSYSNEKRLTGLDHNERLEYLGDAVLELCVSDLLIHKFPDAREGEMSKIRASLVNETALAEVARKIELGRFLFLGKGEEQAQGRNKDSLVSDAFEALIGAIYLDGGFSVVFRIVRNLFLPDIMRATKEDINRDYKTKLQEEVQLRFKVAPDYRLILEEGPDHSKIFHVDVYVNGQKFSSGTGKSKKQAEQLAAQNALQSFQK